MVMILLLAAYLIGSIPFGLILARAFGYGDIRTIGSGNIGATNVARTGNKLLAALTVLFDGGKSALVVLIVLKIGFPIQTGIIVGICAVLGHIFPLWLNFKGGKGFASTLGALIAATPITGIISVLAWIAGVAITRISSVGAFAVISIAPIITAFVYGLTPAAFTLVLSAIVAFKHKDNIVRLLNKTEPKIGKK